MTEGTHCSCLFDEGTQVRECLRHKELKEKLDRAEKLIEEIRLAFSKTQG